MNIAALIENLSRAHREGATSAVVGYSVIWLTCGDVDVGDICQVTGALRIRGRRLGAAALREWRPGCFARDGEEYHSHSTSYAMVHGEWQIAVSWDTPHPLPSHLLSFPTRHSEIKRRPVGWSEPQV